MDCHCFGVLAQQDGKVVLKTEEVLSSRSINTQKRDLEKKTYKKKVQDGLTKMIKWQLMMETIHATVIIYIIESAIQMVLLQWRLLQIKYLVQNCGIYSIFKIKN